MPTRLTLTHAQHEWTAEVEAGRVTLAGPAEVFLVEDAPGERLQTTVEDDPGGRPPGSTPGVVRLTGAAVRDGDVVWVGIDGAVFEFRVRTGATRARAASRGPEALTPPMSATVVRIAVKPGDRVQAGDTLIVLEAMKMELPIRAPHDATITAVHCREGELVQPETVLVDLE